MTGEAILQGLELASNWAIPALMLLIVIAAALKGVPMYESFVTGAKEGFGVAISIIPYLVAILFVIKVFIESGIFADLKWGLAYACQQLGWEGIVPTFDLLPLALTRPLSGSGSRGVLVELFDTHHPDSWLGNTASIMMGSSETTFYILTVYYGSVGIKRLRHTLPACLTADLVGLVMAVTLGFLLFAR